MMSTCKLSGLHMQFVGCRTCGTFLRTQTLTLRLVQASSNYSHPNLLQLTVVVCVQRGKMAPIEAQAFKEGGKKGVDLQVTPGGLEASLSERAAGSLGMQSAADGACRVDQQ